MSKTITFLLLLLLLLTPPPAGASLGRINYVYHVIAPNDPPAWVPVTQYLVSSGCKGCECGSTWVPNTIENHLFEKPSDRAQRGLGVGDANPPTGLPVWDGRDSCSSGVLAAGTWYHNGYFSLHWDFGGCHWDEGGAYVCNFTGSWDGPSSEGWNFAEDMGMCPTGTPRHPSPPTATPVHHGPTPTPPPPSSCRGDWVVLRKPGADWRYAPPYPVVVGQDESARGLDVLVDAHGGWAEKRARRPARHCDDASCTHWHWVCRVRTLAHYDDPIVKIAMGMDLSEASRAWIEGELASRYPGAHVQEKLPWERTLWTGRAMSVETGIRRYPAQDPGDHEGDITVETAGTPLSGPQEYVIHYDVPVYLRDATEWQEWGK